MSAREIFQAAFIPANNDKLDAIVAWLLGYLWTSGEGNVVLLGDRRVGNLIVPAVLGFVERFAEFLREESLFLS